MKVNNGKKSEIQREIEKEVNQGEFNVKESQPYNVSVLMNHHQELGEWYNNVKSPTDF